MVEVEKAKCQNCGQQITQKESLKWEGQVLCEDCYIEASHRIRACDPWAVHSARQFRKMSGIEAAEGLTQQQRAIYEFIKSKGKVTIEELSSTFHLPYQEAENQIAILRHCELIKGQQEGDKIYITIF